MGESERDRAQYLIQGIVSGMPSLLSGACGPFTTRQQSPKKALKRRRASPGGGGRELNKIKGKCLKPLHLQSLNLGCILFNTKKIRASFCSIPEAL